MSAAPAEQLRGELRQVQSHEMAALFAEPSFDTLSEALHMEVYGNSLSTLRRLGRASIESVGLAEAIQLTFDDFSTKLTEMLKTDEDYGHEVDVNRDDKHFTIVDEKVCNDAGVPMVEVVRNGYEASKESTIPQLREIQSVRDEGDVLIAEEVDRLAPGEALVAISVEPIEQLEGAHGKFWHDLGYRKGIAYIQMYCRVDETTMAANAYSVDHSDLEKWRQILLKRGVDVPDDVDANTFSRCVYKFDATYEAAKQVVAEIKQEHYEATGVDHEKIDTKQLLAENEEVVTGMFVTYYPQIARALVSGSNDPVLKAFASEALRSLDTTKLKPEVIRQILRISNSSRFDDEMARTLSENLIPYATVEIIRSKFKKPKDTMDFSSPRPQTITIVPPRQIEYGQWSNLNDQHMHQLALSGIQNGIAAGRSYGGCNGVNLAAEQTNEAGARNYQDNYGGNGSASTKEDDGPDGMGPLRFKCTEGHWNQRKPGQLLEECCVRGCKKGSVGCK